MPINFQLLNSQPPPTQTQVVNIPGTSSGGDSGLGGILSGVKGLLNGIFGSNPVSTANNALNMSLQNMNPTDIPKALLPNSMGNSNLPNSTGNTPLLQKPNLASPATQINNTINSNNQLGIPQIQQMTQRAFPNNPVMQQVALTQATHESNLLNKPSGLATRNNNLFGMTGNGDKGSSVLTGNLDTSPQHFANYSSPLASMQSYANLMHNPRYKDVIAAKTPEEAFKALQNAGYATDPHYASQLTALNKQLQEKFGSSQNLQVNTNRAIQASQTGDPMKVAAQYLGDGRKNHAEVLGNFFNKSGMGNINIQTTPWCAAYVGSVLEASGIKGTHSLAAKSYLNWGTPTKTPTKGDVVVYNSMTGAGPEHGHVGFFDSFVQQGGKTYIRTLGGNQDGKVSYKNYPLDKVAGFRQPPTAEEIKQKGIPNQHLTANTPEEAGIPPYQPGSAQPMTTPIVNRWNQANPSPLKMPPPQQMAQNSSLLTNPAYDQWRQNLA